jgi:uncharacterized protein YjeT (DUF2065 family)
MRPANQAEINDHERDLRKHERRLSDLHPDQALAICKLIGAMEGIITSGCIGCVKTELELRVMVAEALTAFGLPSAWEHEIAAVRQ